MSLSLSLSLHIHAYIFLLSFCLFYFWSLLFWCAYFVVQHSHDTHFCSITFVLSFYHRSMKDLMLIDLFCVLCWSDASGKLNQDGVSFYNDLIDTIVEAGKKVGLVLNLSDSYVEMEQSLLWVSYVMMKFSLQMWWLNLMIFFHSSMDCMYVCMCDEILCFFPLIWWVSYVTVKPLI